MPARCGDLLDIDAQLLATDASARTAALLSTVKRTGRATTIELAIWDGDSDRLRTAIRDELAAASLL